MKPSKIFFTMTHHHTYTSIDRILKELQSRNVDVCRDVVYNNVCGGLKGELGDRIAYLLDFLPMPDEFEWPIKIIKKPAKKKKIKKPPEPYFKSKYKGVYGNSRGWQARIAINGKTKFLGQFKSEIKAARVWNEAAEPLGRELNKIPQYKGIYPDKGGYAVQIHRNGKTEYVGFRKTKEEAAMLWNEVAAPLGRKLNEVSV